VRILHISDIHFAGELGPADQTAVLKALGATATRLDYDTVVISGDIAKCGRQDQYDQASRFVDIIAEQRPVFVVPGNHDVARERADAKALTNAYSNDEVYNLNRSDALNTERFKNFISFSTRFTLDWQQKITVTSANLGEFSLIGINTALLSHRPNEDKKLCIDIEDLQAVLVGLESRPIIVIGHHPFDFLSDWNCEKVRTILGREFLGAQIYLCGHRHADRGSSHQDTTGSGLVTFQAGASYQGSDWENSFRLMVLDTSSPVDSQLYRYNTQSGTFDLDGSRSHPVPVLWPRKIGLAIPDGGTLEGASISRIAGPSEKAEDLVRQLDDYFAQVWEPENMGSSLQKIFWPVRLRRPTLIHASQAFIAAAFLRLGVKVTLCLDDFGNTILPGPFLDRIEKHFSFVGANASYLEIISAQKVLTEERVAKSWNILSQWLTENSARLERVLNICKLLVHGGSEDHIREALSKKPRRILTPAVVWSCLDYVMEAAAQDGQVTGLMTLGGHDERDFWHVWGEIFDCQ
jgi:3',5'-cyclic AMP phosphodiesterase CpdA